MAEGRLAGKVSLITGVGGGMGRAAAVEFVRQGARVWGCDVNSDGLRETQRLAEEFSGQLVTEIVDLSDDDQAKEWVDGSAIAAGGIDVLYNNAASTRTAPIDAQTVENWRFTLANEIDLVLFAVRHAWPHLVTRGGGSIINTASIQAIRASGVGGVADAAGKGAVLALSRQLALEGGPHGIRSNAILPGLIVTPVQAPYLAQREYLDRALAHQALKILGQPEDVAQLAVYLASDESRFMTGAEIVIDGGTVLAIP